MLHYYKMRDCYWRQQRMHKLDIPSFNHNYSKALGRVLIYDTSSALVKLHSRGAENT